MKNRKQHYEYIGKLNPEIARYWNISEHANKPIIIYKSQRQHIIDHHLQDFGSIEKIDHIWSKLSNIIKKPDEVFYNPQTKGLEYYKKFDDMILVAVRINFGSTLKIKSFYPANKGKIKNRKSKEQEMIIKHMVNEDVLI